MGEINSQANVERTINDFVAAKLGTNVPLEVYRRQITLGNKDNGGRLTFKGFCVTVPKRVEKQVTNILLRDNKYNGFINLRFRRFHRWGNMTHGELLSLGRRHTTNMGKLTKEFVSNFDPVDVYDNSIASPIHWVMSQKNIKRQPLFYSAEKNSKGNDSNL